MTRRLLSFVLLSVILACLLCSCTGAEFSGGQALSAAEMQQMLGDAPRADDTLAQEKTYYFVAGNGTVYHSDEFCPYLKNSHNVQSGALSQALGAGKSKLCSACAKAGEKDTLPTLTDEESARICYYTAGGGVWHYDAACPSLAHSQSVLTGTVEQARTEGKTRACTRCGE